MKVVRTRELQPIHGLWKTYRPEEAEFAFRAKTLADARAWRRRTRKALAEALGFQDSRPVPLRPRVIETVDRGDHIRQKVLLRTGPDLVMPVYVLIPKLAGRQGRDRARRLPVVLAFHGHGYGVKDIVGLWEDGGERFRPSGPHKDFAVALCRRGFLVAAPEIACFGERQNDYAHLQLLGSPVPTSCAQTANLAAHLGRTVLGLRVWEARRLVDYLGSRGDADVDRLGAMGISGGGLHTFFSTCIDERIRAAVVSGYFCTFRDSILGVHHCQCNFVPGLGRFGEMYDLAGLIAPRPMLVESASRDEIFPQTAVRRAVRRAREVWGVFGAPGSVEADFFEGRHEISGARAYDFLAEHLGA